MNEFYPSEREERALAEQEYYMDLVESGIDPFEARERARVHFKSSPRPTKCRQCGRHLISDRGYVGEEILYCPKHGIQWEDTEDAISRVI